MYSSVYPHLTLLLTNRDNWKVTTHIHMTQKILVEQLDLASTDLPRDWELHCKPPSTCVDTLLIKTGKNCQLSNLFTQLYSPLQWDICLCCGTMTSRQAERGRPPVKDSPLQQPLTVSTHNNHPLRSAGVIH